MKQSITQELTYGCGVACFAFVCDITFEEAVTILGRGYSVKHGWRPSDLVAALNQYGLSYKNCYVRKKPGANYPDGTIILIERSALYPVGHYVVLHNKQWMDPWINMSEAGEVEDAESGFRLTLPGRAMYALMPTSLGP